MKTFYLKTWKYAIAFSLAIALSHSVFSINLNVSGITDPTAANGTYIPNGTVNGCDCWVHISGGYYIYNGINYFDWNITTDFNDNPANIYTESTTMTSPFGLVWYNHNAYSDIITVTVIPTVSSVSVPSDGTFKAGDNLDFIVNFSDAVSITGTPTLPITLNTGGTVNASYAIGTGTMALTFRYTVAAGNLDTDGISVGSAIVDNGGTLKSDGNISASLMLNSVGSTANVKVDAIVPTATITAGMTAGGDALVNTTEEASNLNVEVQSSEATGTQYLVPLEPATNIDALAGTAIRRAVSAGANTDTNIAISAISGEGFTADLAAPTISSVSATTADGTFKIMDVKIAIADNSVITDRFQLHASDMISGLVTETSPSKLEAYAIRNTEIRVIGEVSNNAIAKLYDLQGRVILVKNLEDGSLNTISTANYKTGIYVLSVKDNSRLQTFKLLVRE